MPTPSLSVVIPVLGRYELLARAIDRLSVQAVEPQSFELVVVSDATEPSPSRIDAAIGRPSFAARHLRAALPGAAAARERGWREAEAPIVLFIDSDLLATRELIGEHLRGHGELPEPEAAVLGRVRWAPGLRVTAFMRWVERRIQFNQHTIRGAEAAWGHFHTANVSLKRELLEQVGGFDVERFPFLYEDTDLAYRLSEHGLRLRFNRRALGDHWHETTLEAYRRRMAAVAPMELRFVRRHPELRPHFHELFSEALRLPPARGRLAPLVRYLPPGLPLLGRRAWLSADHYFRQQLAPAFLEGWEAALRAEAAADQPSPSAPLDRSSSPGGRASSGPK